MEETMERTQLQTVQEFTLPEVSPATDDAIVAYLRRNYKFAEIAAEAERDALILNICDRFGITLSEQELQAAGNEFRLEHRLLGGAETLAWLSQQRISVEDWSQGIRVELLKKKLKEHLFSDQVDTHYLSNRKDYKRVAISRIIVKNLTDALKIVQKLREEPALFCALALEYSNSQATKEKGGFAGINFLSRLMPEIKQAIFEAQEGQIVGPIETKLGYHIIKVEKLFPVELNELVRQEVLDTLFQGWLKEQGFSTHR